MWTSRAFARVWTGCSVVGGRTGLAAHRRGAAVLRRFTVISGGPGTGKTTTVVRLLALLLEQAAGDPLRIGLAAPTGKAAARMQEVIRSAKRDLPVEAAVRDAIPEEASTIHRLLGWRPGTSASATTARIPLAAGRPGSG